MTNMFSVDSSHLKLLFRNNSEAMVMNKPEVPKQKEKQGFFRAIKKKKKKSQPVTNSIFTLHP